ncbi:NUDIX hydrolase [Kitasatospora sp. NPDC056138]|uniref:NUDIX hydrolase n=1 Tax=Kitasatospora sp. NPDC056138 TaxID=3345724 RepID=UPI0035DA71B4
MAGPPEPPVGASRSPSRPAKPPGQPSRGLSRDTWKRSAGALALDRIGRVLLVRRATGTPSGLPWELPGGGTGPGEAPYQAALRELREATGLVPGEHGYAGFIDYADVESGPGSAAPTGVP